MNFFCKLSIVFVLAVLISPHAFSKKITFPVHPKKKLLYSFNTRSDSIQRFSFSYQDKKRGFRPYITPALLIGAGVFLHNSDPINFKVRDYAQQHFAYTGTVDDYLVYAPLATVYGLNMLGVKGKNNFGNRSALAVKSMVLNEITVYLLKTITHTQRPNGGERAFPSGHTSLAFALAHFMHKEFGEKNIWFSVGAYSCATSVGLLRVAKNEHWLADVVAGAGIGILSTELVYRTHLYKWDKEHLKNFDILPFRTQNQKGLTLVYTF